MLDNFFFALSCVVSVPFYTGFLPLLFWVCLLSCPTGFIALLSVFSVLIPFDPEFFFFEKKSISCRVDTAGWLGR
jgi:hypothetical protein